MRVAFLAWTLLMGSTLAITWFAEWMLDHGWFAP